MTFAHPEYFLLLLLIPIMIAGAILTSRRQSRQMTHLITERLRPILYHPRSPRRRWYALTAFMLALTLLILALASPSAGFRERPETVRGRNIMIAIDVSRSMFAEDVNPNRFHAAKASALELLDRFPHDRIGIIAFSGMAWVQSPLTIDHSALRDTLQQLDYARNHDNDWIPRDGSDLATAVRLAVKKLHKTGQQDNTLVILSDGETHHGGIEQAAHEADREGVTIFSAGFGTGQGTMIPDPASTDGHFHDREGTLVLTRLESKPLFHLADSTGGVYSKGAGSHFLSRLEIAIQHSERFEIEGRRRRIATPHFQWFLAPSMLLFAVGILFNSGFRFQRARHHPSLKANAPLPGRISPIRPSSPSMSALALAGLWFAFAFPAEAGLLPRSAAGRALAKGDHEQAFKLFEDEILRARGERKPRLQLGAATAAYRLRKYRAASQSYSGALLSQNRSVQEQAHFGLGNTHYHEGLQLKHRLQTADAIPRCWRDSILHFDEVLLLNPDNREAAENRDYVKRQLEKWLADQEKTDDHPPAGQPNPTPDPPERPEQEPEQPSEKNPTRKPDSTPEDNNATTPDNRPSPPDKPGENNPGTKETKPLPPDSPNPHPAETSKKFARRILRDNADFELKLLPLKPLGGRRPKKDW